MHISVHARRGFRFKQFNLQPPQQFCATRVRYSALARASEIGVKSSASARAAFSSMRSSNARPRNARSHFMARFGTAAMPPKAARVLEIFAPSVST